MREPLSVIVIARDEERDLPRCLDSVAWADERVVVDSGSTDATVAVAEARGARVFRRAWTGYVDQKNFALDQASHEWVLSLDADEWLPPASQEAVQRALEEPSSEAYVLSRRNAFAGAFLRRTWTPDRHVRLFRRDRARFAGGRVHESVQLAPGSRIGRLDARIDHAAYDSIADYVARMNRYTDLAAATLADRGRRFSIVSLVLGPPATFVKLYLLRGGFVDGVRGFVVAAGSAFYVLLKQAKLWELGRTSRTARPPLDTAEIGRDGSDRGTRLDHPLSDEALLERARTCLAEAGWRIGERSLSPDVPLRVDRHLLVRRRSDGRVLAHYATVLVDPRRGRPCGPPDDERRWGASSLLCIPCGADGEPLVAEEGLGADERGLPGARLDDEAVLARARQALAETGQEGAALRVAQRSTLRRAGDGALVARRAMVWVDRLSPTAGEDAGAARRPESILEVLWDRDGEPLILDPVV